MKSYALCLLATALAVNLFMQSATAQTAQSQGTQWLSSFSDFYETELGSVTPCDTQSANTFRVCSNALKNDGNAPFVLHHGDPTDTTVVLFHGLSDSPFFFSHIAPTLHNMGHTVIVALLPGHGKLDADDDMDDKKLAQRWASHVDEVMAFAHANSENVYVGGFSTGGALATQHVLKSTQPIKGLMLFSGALALDESVEDMAGYWGIKTLAKLLDWQYETQGPNPYKYPSVARHSAFMLVDVIFDVRDKLEKNGGIDIPIFSAHSEADVTTPIRGVKALMDVNKGLNVPFFIEKQFDVCHADLVVSNAQIVEMAYDASSVDTTEPCKVPVANPVHGEMLEALTGFMNQIARL